jgi:hypothetical protein
MPLLGKAALAMWWNMAPDVRPEFEDWHSHEHFPERLGIAGFKRATRWSQADGGEGIFQVYEVDAHATLASPDYLARLNAPSAWSARLMPHHRQMVRSQCHVEASHGAHVARHALPVRLSPQPGRERELRAALGQLAAQLAIRPGCVGGHLLRHEAPAVAQTTEQKIRGSDRFADWIFLACGYDVAALKRLAEAELSPEALVQAGALPEAHACLYTLSLSATAGEFG